MTNHVVYYSIVKYSLLINMHWINTKQLYQQMMRFPNASDTQLKNVNSACRFTYILKSFSLYHLELVHALSYSCHFKAWNNCSLMYAFFNWITRVVDFNRLIKFLYNLKIDLLVRSKFNHSDWFLLNFICPAWNLFKLWSFEKLWWQLIGANGSMNFSDPDEISIVIDSISLY